MNEQYKFDYERYESLSALPEADRELADAAKEACGQAYAPYSGYRVGAAARLASGRVITGSNQESEVFPAGVCAERSLLFHHQAHYKDDPIEALAIASLPDERECYPCGICRQVINDSQNRQGNPIRVIMTGRDSATVIDTAEKLLPFTFRL
ncbi:MAG: cytidine deaminase [Rikenellaceae bacterium]|nr:cytidine deaminase [Rikenellaceae bacterium]